MSQDNLRPSQQQPPVEPAQPAPSLTMTPQLQQMGQPSGEPKVPNQSTQFDGTEGLPRHKSQSKPTDTDGQNLDDGTNLTKPDVQMTETAPQPIKDDQQPVQPEVEQEKVFNFDGAPDPEQPDVQPKQKRKRRTKEQMRLHKLEQLNKPHRKRNRKVKESWADLDAQGQEGQDNSGDQSNSSGTGSRGRKKRRKTKVNYQEQDSPDSLLYEDQGSSSDALANTQSKIKGNTILVPDQDQDKRPTQSALLTILGWISNAPKTEFRDYVVCMLAENYPKPGNADYEELNTLFVRSEIKPLMEKYLKNPQEVQDIFDSLEPYDVVNYILESAAEVQMVEPARCTRLLCDYINKLSWADLKSLKYKNEFQTAFMKEAIKTYLTKFRDYILVKFVYLCCEFKCLRTFVKSARALRLLPNIQNRWQWIKIENFKGATLDNKLECFYFGVTRFYPNLAYKAVVMMGKHCDYFFRDDVLTHLNSLEQDEQENVMLVLSTCVSLDDEMMPIVKKVTYRALATGGFFVCQELGTRKKRQNNPTPLGELPIDKLCRVLELLSDKDIGALQEAINVDKMSDLYDNLIEESQNRKGSNLDQSKIDAYVDKLKQETDGLDALVPQLESAIKEKVHSCNLAFSKYFMIDSYQISLAGTMILKNTKIGFYQIASGQGKTYISIIIAIHFKTVDPSCKRVVIFTPNKLLEAQLRQEIKKMTTEQIFVTSDMTFSDYQDFDLAIIDEADTVLQDGAVLCQDNQLVGLKAMLRPKKVFMYSATFNDLDRTIIRSVIGAGQVKAFPSKYFISWEKDNLNCQKSNHQTRQGAKEELFRIMNDNCKTKPVFIFGDENDEFYNEALIIEKTVNDGNLKVRKIETAEQITKYRMLLAGKKEGIFFFNRTAGVGVDFKLGEDAIVLIWKGEQTYTQKEVDQMTGRASRVQDQCNSLFFVYGKDDTEADLKTLLATEVNDYQHEGDQILQSLYSLDDETVKRNMKMIKTYLEGDKWKIQWSDLKTHCKKLYDLLINAQI